MTDIYIYMSITVNLSSSSSPSSLSEWFDYLREYPYVLGIYKWTPFLVLVSLTRFHKSKSVK